MHQNIQKYVTGFCFQNQRIFLSLKEYCLLSVQFKFFYVTLPYHTIQKHCI